MGRKQIIYVFFTVFVIIILSISMIGCSTSPKPSQTATIPPETLTSTTNAAMTVSSTFTQGTTTTKLPSTTSQSQNTTVTPMTTTQTPSSTSSTKTIKITDGVNDLFDGNAAPVSGEAYLDIIEAEISIVGTPPNYLFRMKVNGPVPTQLDDPKASIEWDFFIDSDLNNATGWNYPIACNDIGPNYMVRYYLRGTQNYSQLLDISANKFTNLAPPRITSNTIEIGFTWTLMQQIENFNCVVAVRKWIKTASDQEGLSVVDKTPNEGHYHFPKGS